jgi:hypothetical protein
MKNHYKSHLTRLGMSEDEIKVLLLNLPKRRNSIYSVESINSDSSNISVNSSPTLSLADSQFSGSSIDSHRINFFNICNHPMCCIHGRKNQSVGNYDHSRYLIDPSLIPSRSLTPDPSWSFKL